MQLLSALVVLTLVITFVLGIVGGIYLYVRYVLLLGYIRSNFGEYYNSFYSSSLMRGDLNTYQGLNKSIWKRAYENYNDDTLNEKCNRYRVALKFQRIVGYIFVACLTSMIIYGLAQRHLS